MNLNLDPEQNHKVGAGMEGHVCSWIVSLGSARLGFFSTPTTTCPSMSEVKPELCGSAYETAVLREQTHRVPSLDTP